MSAPIYKEPVFFDKNFEEKYCEYLNKINLKLDNYKQLFYCREAQGVTKRVFDYWLKTLRERATLHYGGAVCKSKWEINKNSFHFPLDDDGFDFIRDIFTQKLEITHLHGTWDGSTGLGYTNLKSILVENIPNAPNGRNFTISLCWKPDNPYLYPMKRKRRYCNDPAMSAKCHLELAKQSVGTDFAIVSKQDGTSIPIHAIYTYNQTDYFRKLLGSGLSESKTKSVTLDYSKESIEQMRHFIYTGELEKNPDSSQDAVELLKLSHELDMRNLYDHCLDELDQLFSDSEKLEIQQLLSILQAACLFKEEDLELSCLEQIETWETEGTSFDWSQIAPKHYAKLLGLSAKNSLELTEAKLTSALEALHTHPSPIK